MTAGNHDYPAPSGWTPPTWSQSYGIYYQGEAPVLTVSAARALTSYTVRDYWGNVVTSGATGAGTTVTIPAPQAGWAPGWYRVYLTAVASVANYGTCAGEANFVVLRDDPRFPARPASFASRSGNPRMMTAKALIGAGTSRIVIQDASDLANITGSLADAALDAQDTNDWWAAPANPLFAEPNRPARRPWAAFPTLAVDRLVVGGLLCYPATPAVDGSQVFVQVEAGSVSGQKVTVRYPDASTVVETYDNQASPAAAVTAMAGSTLVKAFGTATSWSGTVTATALGRAQRDGVATVVSTLWPLVQCFEGPGNERPLDAKLAHEMRLFQAAVHAGNPSAKALGPCLVTVENTGWSAFGDAGGFGYCDEISSHFYSITTGGLHAARTILAAFESALTTYGADSKPRWDTESNTCLTSWKGTFHPRSAAAMPAWMLLAEQHAIPRERCIPWYDVSHGFWDFPGWLFAKRSGVPAAAPHVAMLRTLAEETFDRPFQTRLDFGPVADDLIVGSVYRVNDSSTGVVALCAFQRCPGAQVTFQVNGSSAPLTVVNCFGATSTVTPGPSGLITLPVEPEVTYLRLPAGVTVSVVSALGMPTVTGYGRQPRYAAATMGGRGAGIQDGTLSASRINADQYWAAPAGATCDVVLDFGVSYRFDRILVWGWTTAVGNNQSTPLDFTVQGSNDGTIWTVLATVATFAEAVSIPWVSYIENAKTETYWQPPTVHNVTLSGPVVYRYVKISATAISYGGEPDAIGAVETFAPAAPILYLQEVMVLCDDNTRPQVVVASA